MSQIGLGKDIWTLPLWTLENVLYVSHQGLLIHRPWLVCADTLDNQYYYIGELFYISGLVAIKISILLFLLRVFPRKDVRLAILITIGFCSAYGFVFVIITAFQCTPVDHAWLQVDSSHAGHCNDISVQGWMCAIFNIILDIVILVLPLKHLLKLQINLKKKIMVMIMFSLGVL